MAQRGEIFQSIPVGRVGRTNFNLSHQLTGNFKEGICYPIFCEETLPGDSWRINTYNISKLETLLAPAMQRTDASLLWFKIPKRLCMKNFKKWYTGGSDGMASVEKPYFRLSSYIDWIRLNDSYFFSSDTQTKLLNVTNIFFGPGSVWQMVGLPIPYKPNVSTGIINFVSPFELVQGTPKVVWDESILDQKIDLIPFIAYAKLYDEYFRDQSLSESIFIADEDYANFNPNWSYNVGFQVHGSSVNVFEGGEFNFKDIIPLFIAFRRAWRKDYFTSALPTPQRGPEVSLEAFQPGEVPISVSGSAMGALVGDPNNTSTPLAFGLVGGQNPGNFTAKFELPNGGSGGFLYNDDTGDKVRSIAGRIGFEGMEGTADLSGLSPITIAAFRNLFKLQAFLEKNNVAGGRFIEFILAHWAERVPDFTVQRPVFVRATSIPVIVSEVTATANTDDGSNPNTQLGDQAGRAKGQGNLGSCRIYTQEPSIIIGIYCVTPPPSYVSQGIPKKFQRLTRWDEPYAEFQHIGEQAILNKEIWIGWNTDSDPESEFGYQQRYSEFKYLPDRVVGEFATNLAYWHQARIFSQLPRLNQSFIENIPSDRIFAVENQNPVIADFWFDIKCSRKLSKFSTPKLN